MDPTAQSVTPTVGDESEQQMRHDDERVGPRSWYWPTRYKLLAALVVVVVVLAFFILVNPSPGSGGS
jgi:hypothetical protein